MCKYLNEKAQWFGQNIAFVYVSIRPIDHKFNHVVVCLLKKLSGSKVKRQSICKGVE